jgi:Thymidylate kinase
MSINFSNSDNFPEQVHNIVNLFNNTTQINNLFCIEGCDKAGKSTVIDLVDKGLIEKWYNINHFRFPGLKEGEDSVYEMIRTELKTNYATLPAMQQMYLHLACFKAAEAKCSDVAINICDRYLLSTLVYQCDSPYCYNNDFHIPDISRGVSTTIPLDVFYKTLNNSNSIKMPRKTYIMLVSLDELKRRTNKITKEYYSYCAWARILSLFSPYFQIISNENKSPEDIASFIINDILNIWSTDMLIGEQNKWLD